jgi:hypothetical protein
LESALKKKERSRTVEPQCHLVGHRFKVPQNNDKDWSLGKEVARSMRDGWVW